MWRRRRRWCDGGRGHFVWEVRGRVSGKIVGFSLVAKRSLFCHCSERRKKWAQVHFAWLYNLQWYPRKTCVQPKKCETLSTKSTGEGRKGSLLESQHPPRPTTAEGGPTRAEKARTTTGRDRHGRGSAQKANITTGRAQSGRGPMTAPKRVAEHQPRPRRTTRKESGTTEATTPRTEQDLRQDTVLHRTPPTARKGSESCHLEKRRAKSTTIPRKKCVRATYYFTMSLNLILFIE